MRITDKARTGAKYGGEAEVFIPTKSIAYSDPVEMRIPPNGIAHRAQAKPCLNGISRSINSSITTVKQVPPMAFIMAKINTWKEGLTSAQGFPTADAW